MIRTNQVNSKKSITISKVTNKETFVVIKDMENTNYYVWPEWKLAFNSAKLLKAQDEITIEFYPKLVKGRVYNHVTLITTKLPIPDTTNTKIPITTITYKLAVMNACKEGIERTFGTTINKHPAIIPCINSLFIEVNKRDLRIK